MRAAVNYYCTGSTLNALNLLCFDDAQYDALTLRRFINDGHILLIARAQYSGAADPEGHAYTIVGYTTIYINGVMHYRYFVYDPDPSPRPNPWNNPVTTSGQELIRSYEWICNGNNLQYNDDSPDGKIWNQVIVMNTAYAYSTTEPAYNQ